MVRTFIYGSCVSRDTFEYLRPHGYELVDYIARQSLLSVYSEAAPSEMPEFETASAFQHRMVAGDWSGSLLPTLRRRRQEIDLLLWDLCDERLGVWRLPNGHIVTRSVDSIASGLDAKIAPSAERLAFGSRRHRSWFKAQAARFRLALDGLDLRSRTLVLAPAWAVLADDGEPSPSSFGIQVDQANSLFPDYYRAIDRLVGVPVIRLPASYVSGDANHRWGRAPFHYAPDVYTALAQNILRLSG